MLGAITPTDWTPLVMALSAVLSGASAYGGHRVAKRQHKPQIDKLAAETTRTITEAAENAVRLVEGRMTDAMTQLSVAQGQIAELQATLEATRRELVAATEARAQLLADVAHRDARIEHLEAEVARLQAELDALSARVGGRRTDDVA